MERSEVRGEATLTQLKIVNERGELRCCVGCVNDRACIQMIDNTGVARLELSLGDAGKPSLSMTSDKGKTTLLITTGDAGEPRIWLYDDRGSDPRIGIHVDQEAGAHVEVWGNGPEACVSLSARRDGSVCIYLQGDREGDASASAAISKEGTFDAVLSRNKEAVSEFHVDAHAKT